MDHVHKQCHRTQAKHTNPPLQKTARVLHFEQIHISLHLQLLKMYPKALLCRRRRLCTKVKMPLSGAVPAY